MSLNALAASDTLIVPLQCEYYALEGLSQLLSTVRTVKQLYNEHLELEGVIYTMYDSRLKLNQQVIDEVNKYFPNKAYKTMRLSCQTEQVFCSFISLIRHPFQFG